MAATSVRPSLVQERKMVRLGVKEFVVMGCFLLKKTNLSMIHKLLRKPPTTLTSMAAEMDILISLDFNMLFATMCAGYGIY